jgi:hypothetical protein
MLIALSLRGARQRVVAILSPSPRPTCRSPARPQFDLCVLNCERLPRKRGCSAIVERRQSARRRARRRCRGAGVEPCAPFAPQGGGGVSLLMTDVRCARTGGLCRPFTHWPVAHWLHPFLERVRPCSYAATRGRVHSKTPRAKINSSFIFAVDFALRLGPTLYQLVTSHVGSAPFLQRSAPHNFPNKLRSWATVRGARR